MQVEQHVLPHHTANRLQFLDVPQAALAEFAGISRPLICLWLAGERGLSLDAQFAVGRALKFFEHVAETSDVPVNFQNTAALQKHWTKFLRIQTKAAVVLISAELVAHSAEKA